MSLTLYESPIREQDQTTTPGTPCSTLCEKCVGSITSPANQYREGAGDGAYGLSSLSEKTRMSNHLRMTLQRQHALLSYFKTLSIGPVWGSNPRPPAQTVRIDSDHKEFLNICFAFLILKAFKLFQNKIDSFWQFVSRYRRLLDSIRPNYDLTHINYLKLTKYKVQKQRKQIHYILILVTYLLHCRIVQLRTHTHLLQPWSLAAYCW